MDKNEIQNIVDAMMKKLKDEDKSTELYNSLETKIKELQNNIDLIETNYKKNEIKVNMNRTETILKNLKSDTYKSILDKVGKDRFEFSFDIKRNAGVIMDPNSFFQDGVSPIVLPNRESGVNKPEVRALHVSDLIQWGTTNSNSVDWIERSGKTDGSAMRAEGGAMGQGEVTYIEKSTKVKIISEYMKVTNESLKDVDFLASEINTELLSDLRLKLDDQLLSGNGSGNNLKGILEYATDWNAGSFAGTITNPNNADVLRVGINQILIAGKGKWVPTHILMNPTDIAKLDMLKITDGRYIEIPFYSSEGETVKRVQIVANVGMTEDKFLIADFTKAKGFVRDSLTVRIFDQNENDPLYNRSTITGNVRVAFRIKGWDTGAFVYGDFSDAIADL